MMNKAELWAWAGWLLFSCTMLLYYRLWTSAGVEELRAMKRALAKARITIGELREAEQALKERMEAQKAAHAELYNQFSEMRGQFAQLQSAYSKMGERFDKVLEDLRREKELRDAQYYQLMQAKSKLGEL